MMSRNTLFLEPVPPFRLDLTVWTLRRRPDNAVDRWRLRGLRGVGRWTAEYVLLRGLGRTTIFPGDDVGARNNLQRWLQLAGPLDYEGVQRTLARWQRFGGLIYFHLLLDRLEEAGHLQAGVPQSQVGPDRHKTADVSS